MNHSLQLLVLQVLGKLEELVPVSKRQGGVVPACEEPFIEE